MRGWPACSSSLASTSNAMLLSRHGGDAASTLFVFLKGHHLWEYYFSLADTSAAANEALTSPTGK
jgi:hypothetical protein